MHLNMTTTKLSVFLKLTRQQNAQIYITDGRGPHGHLQKAVGFGIVPRHADNPYGHL